MMFVVLVIGILAILIFGVSTAGRSLEELNESQSVLERRRRTDTQ
ncbi:MAG TPA: hypothetical protein VIP98_20620 [Microlunatus sp.]